MDGPPVDPESAWSGYAGATKADPPPGAVKRSRQASVEVVPHGTNSHRIRSCAGTSGLRAQSQDVCAR